MSTEDIRPIPLSEAKPIAEMSVDPTLAKIGWQNAAARAEAACQRAERAAAASREAAEAPVLWLSRSGRRRYQLVRELAEVSRERNELARLLAESTAECNRLLTRLRDAEANPAEGLHGRIHDGVMDVLGRYDPDADLQELQTAAAVITDAVLELLRRERPAPESGDEAADEAYLSFRQWLRGETDA